MPQICPRVPGANFAGANVINWLRIIFVAGIFDVQLASSGE
jgi:hypothetical protein